MNIIKPKILTHGDTIGILATAGAVESKENILKAKEYFENCGYKVVLSENIFDEYRYLAGTDEKKVKAIHDFFLNDEIKAIICMRGGYGAVRLVEKLDYDLIRQHPKIFCGYSDISALSAMIYKRSGLITFSGPLAQSDFGVDSPSEFTLNSFWKAVSTNEQLCFSPDNCKIYKSGNASGIIWGGNLATIVSLCGLDFVPDEDFIFFTEELNEVTYKIDKMMNQLMNIEKFRKNIKAIVLGDFLDIDCEKWLDELFFEIAHILNIPIIRGFKVTHNKDKITIPYGAKALLENNNLKIK